MIYGNLLTANREHIIGHRIASSILEIRAFNSIQFRLLKPRPVSMSGFSSFFFSLFLFLFQSQSSFNRILFDNDRLSRYLPASTHLRVSLQSNRYSIHAFLINIYIYIFRRNHFQERASNNLKTDLLISF